MGNELITNAWATISGKQENRIYTCLHLSSLLRVNPFDVELTKQACELMYSSMSLITLSNVPPRTALCKQIAHQRELLPIKCRPNAWGQGG